MATTLPRTASAPRPDLALAQAPERPVGLKIASLDAWRGMACLAVVAMHSCMPTILNTYPQFASQPVFALALHGGLGVCVFFVISGFCIANAGAVLLARPGGWRRFLVARVRRIYPPYLAATVFFLVLTLAITYAVHHHLVADSARAQMDVAHQGPAFYLATLGLAQIPLHQLLLIGPVWSLDYEVTFYAIVLLAMLAIRLVNAPPARFVDLLNGVTLVSLALLILLPATPIYPLNLWPEFGLGVLLFDLLSHPRDRRPLIVSAAVLLGFALDLALHNVPAVRTGENSTITLFGTCIVTAVLLWLTQPHEARFVEWPVVRALSRVGIFSYSLYLIHEPITGIVLQIAKRLHLYTPRLFGIVFVVEIAVCVALGYLFFRVFESPFVSKTARKIHAVSAA